MKKITSYEFSFRFYFLVYLVLERAFNHLVFATSSLGRHSKMD